jgi:hypothetical protein
LGNLNLLSSLDFGEQLCSTWVDSLMPKPRYAKDCVLRNRAETRRSGGALKSNAFTSTPICARAGVLRQTLGRSQRLPFVL